MKKNLLISVLMTIVTTVLLGLVYPLVVTGLAQVIFPEKANGQLIKRNGTVIASHIIAQPFVGAKLFSPASFRRQARMVMMPATPADRISAQQIRNSLIA